MLLKICGIPGGNCGIVKAGAAEELMIFPGFSRKFKPIGILTFNSGIDWGLLLLN
jgi:hypothetical protein